MILRNFELEDLSRIMLSRKISSCFQIRRISKSIANQTSSNDKSLSDTEKVRKLPPVTDKAQLQMREEFFRREQEWESRVDLTKLSENDKVIHQKHKFAAMSLHLSYEDPFTGLKVMSRWRHFSKGSCCGKACRHCVYDHEKVPDERKVQRRFNGAFWEDLPGFEPTDAS